MAFSISKANPTFAGGKHVYPKVVVTLGAYSLGIGPDIAYRHRNIQPLFTATASALSSTAYDVMTR